ncbi:MULTISPECIES: flagellar basal body rod protein FlgC [Arcobacteraceae]|jgi:flagellar basal-body rod protein FlgC|uniref:Flagellar basal-body rod protein FlgC n=2 Tax=Aliarcobacter skirrowii TaxID=28200 RepID=A0A2U2C1Y4_9BACT|nr:MULTISPECIES: flagellar basal body rod protein FlgC [Arcobacteraceae]AXX85440.1 flagellar proximal rod protein FlgC [Aliarcobacter skirrowii CCUG 10374]AZL54506.1 flagellar basal body rod protein FlgC [Aliarcobacter skirrowii]KAB0621148.1 flagellar basal body rod protein FlgC [Aliarcobacter skirrowii CCUG 10374]MCT7446388.1 flagellar basal body rod protein FlgC [Aliarcobacter skirrowii]MDD2508178.1 flagellar basal body rod protein FlgC [Aliarcobacter skirrowii]
MGFFDGYNVATSGMSAQRTRINVTSANIANAKTTHTAEGGPYKKQVVLFEDVLLANKNKKTNSNDIEVTNSTNSELSLRAVGVKKIIKSDAPPVLRYDPTHPDANEKGYVAYPDINPVVEMVDLIEAMRSYEANVTAFNTHRGIDTKTLDILNGN